MRVQTEHVHRTSDITLERLSDEAARQLLSLLPRSESLKESELEQIVTGAEGNPLYLEELLNAFAEGSACAAARPGLRRSREPGS